jgi:GNAT superfamily N-acetyltransferase
MALLRRAAINDIDLLVKHHNAMFREIHRVDGRSIDEDVFKSMDEQCRRKIEKHFASGMACSWVIEEDAAFVASAGITIFESVPVPFDLNAETAYLHSVYTEPEYRRRGYARRLVMEAMAYCASRGINRIDLAATNAGRPLYESLGFTAAPYIMRFLRRG